MTRALALLSGEVLVMSRQARMLLPKGYVHVINRGANHAPLFERSRDYREFLCILREGLRKFPVTVLAYCLMSNHWHLVVGPVGTKRLSRLIHWVATTHAMRFHHRRGTRGEGRVYHGRFRSHPIESSGQLLQTIRYVERNALCARLVSRAQDWPWGSLADRQHVTPALPLQGGPFLSSRMWIDHVNAGDLLEDEPPRAVEDLWKPFTNRLLRDLADEPGVRKTAKKRRGVGSRGRNHQTHAHVERAEHLRLVELPRALQPGEQRRNRPALAVK